MYKVNHLLTSLYFYAYAIENLLDIESPMQFVVETGRARRLYANSLEFFIQSFLHRAQPKIRGPEKGSRSPFPTS